MDLLSEFIRIFLQILLLTIIYYGVLHTLRGTPGLYQMTAIFFLLGGLYLVINLAGLREMAWFTEKIFYFLPVITVVLFRDEIRRMLSIFYRNFQRRSGRSKQGSNMLESSLLYLTPLKKALIRLSASHTGALIAIEQNIPLEPYAARGMQIHAELTTDNSLLDAIFYTGNPLHDGGVILSHGIIVAAKCVFPSTDKEIPREFGMRHRAAVGLSELTDAILLVVSEETGKMHIARHGELKLMATEKDLDIQLRRALSLQSNSAEQKPDGPFRRFFYKLTHLFSHTPQK